MGNWGLVLPFDTDDVRFARGVEIGLTFARLKATPPHEVLVATMHAANAEMIMRLGEATRRLVRAEDLGNDWLEVTFGGALDTGRDE